MIEARPRAGQTNILRRYNSIVMNASELINEIVTVYQKHGWQLRRVLLRPEVRAQLAHQSALPANVVGSDAEFDALWFSRASQHNREAWELRLVAETPYALFETFEADETEEQREDVRREMEGRLREYVRR